MRKYKISIILPVYNTEKYLNRCFKSILKQTFDSYDVIVINDGSTDNSLQIIKKFAKQNPKIKFFTQLNKGLSSARNLGMEKSNADYILFVDSDDSINKNTLEELYTLAIKDDSCISMTRFRWLTQKGLVIKKEPSYLGYSNEKIFKELVSSKIPTSTCSRLFKKELFTNNNIFFPIGLYFEEIATIYKLHYFAKKISFSNKCHYNYYFNEGSISNTISIKHISDMFKVLISVEKFLVKETIWDLYKDDFYTKCLMNISYLIKQINTRNTETDNVKLYKLLANKILRYSFFIKKEIHKYKIGHKDFFYSSLSNILPLYRYNSNFTNNILNTFESKKLISLSNNLLGLEVLILEELFKFKLNMGIYIVAKGEIYDKIVDKIKDVHIEILGVADKKNLKNKLSLKDNMNLSYSEIFEINKENKSLINIVVASISFASEICDELTKLSRKYGININLITYSDKLNGDLL